MMVYCFDFFEKSKYPRFYEPVMELMRKANHCAFLNRNELEIFIALLKSALDEAKPKDHRAHVETTWMRELQGQISIESGKVDFQIARIRFSPIRKVLEYGFDAQDFFTVDHIDMQEGGVR